MFFNTISIHTGIIYVKMSCMDEEQAFFEQLTLSNFKMWSFTTLKDFNNYSVITTNISDNIMIS